MVYITSDLFGPNTVHDWQTMAQDQHAARLGKRKRQAGDDGPQVNLSRQHRSSPGRDATRLHLHNTPPFEPTNSSSYAFFPSKSHEYTSERRPVKQLKRINPKPSLPKSASHQMDVDLDIPSHAVSDLRSCHACNKAPKRKKDLENYLDCRRCEGRTCFICARQCVGCSKSICKKCIVEVGEEGDAWCLDCYARNINS